MKVRCVELSTFESKLLLAFMKQPKNAPASAGLCRTIYRRMEGQPAFAQSRVQVYNENTTSHIVRTVMVEK